MASKDDLYTTRPPAVSAGLPGPLDEAYARRSRPVRLVKITRPPTEAELREPAPCPVCGADPYSEGCLHVWCDEHQRWTEYNTAECWTGGGFAGGTIFHVVLRCGCIDHDESDDVAAAR